MIEISVVPLIDNLVSVVMLKNADVQVSSFALSTSSGLSTVILIAGPQGQTGPAGAPGERGLPGTNTTSLDVTALDDGLSSDGLTLRLDISSLPLAP